MYEIKLSNKCIAECSHKGECYDDVERWLTKPEIKSFIDQIPAEKIRNYLNEFGAWDDKELKDDVANRGRFLWSAACDCRDEKTNYFVLE